MAARRGTGSGHWRGLARRAGRPAPAGRRDRGPRAGGRAGGRGRWSPSSLGAGTSPSIALRTAGRTLLGKLDWCRCRRARSPTGESPADLTASPSPARASGPAGGTG
jgi:hypothetical protein